jgi:hypothetical protein
VDMDKAQFQLEDGEKSRDKDRDLVISLRAAFNIFNYRSSSFNIIYFPDFQLNDFRAFRDYVRFVLTCFLVQMYPVAGKVA